MNCQRNNTKKYLNRPGPPFPAVSCLGIDSY